MHTPGTRRRNLDSYLRPLGMPSIKKNGKENGIMHLSSDPLPPEPIVTNLNNDKLVEIGPPTLL